MEDYRNRFALPGKVSLVTGASSGVGFETCGLLADAGSDIIAVARNREGLAAVADSVRAKGRQCLVIEADLGEAAQVERAAREALAGFPEIHVLVNNAGMGNSKTLLEQSVEGWDRVLAINLRAPWLLAREIAPQMIARRSGKIINISSQASDVALVEHAAYASSKSGLNSLTRVMTAEWARYNIQCNAVCPTVIMTPMAKPYWGVPERLTPMLAKIPAGRVAETIEVCDLILFLASDASNMINGQSIFIDGGYTAL